MASEEDVGAEEGVPSPESPSSSQPSSEPAPIVPPRSSHLSLVILGVLIGVVVMAYVYLTTR